MEDNLPPTFESMAKILEKNPLKAIRLAQKSNMSVDQMKYEIAAIAYGYAAILHNDEAQRENFYDEGFWKKRDRTMRSGKLLLHVFIYVYGSDEGGPANRASEHSRALQAAFDANVPFGEIPQYIEDNGGFYGLLKPKKAEEKDSSGRDDDERETSSRPATKAVTKPRSVTAPNIDDDAGDVGPIELNDHELRMPVRKAPKPEVEKPELKLLPRDVIATYILMRHRDPTKHEEILQAIKDGKTVTADFSMGKTSEHYELYASGGNFFDTLIEDYSLG